ncbi:MAG: multicopper oxidase domain-containing protein [Nanoarchaeota archaeon]
MMIFAVILMIMATGCATTQAPEPDDRGADSAMPVPPELGTQPAADKVVTFIVTGEDYAFFINGMEAPELRVNVGDTVRIEFTATQGFHDLVVDEFNAATERVRDGGSTTVEFVADKAGTFEYYCSVGSHRANGMWGNLIVE